MSMRSSRGAAVVLAVLLPALAGWNWLQSSDPDVYSGNRHFKAGEYGKALKSYRRALGRGSHEEGVQFDIGTALYKLATKAKGKRREKLLDQAEVAFRHAADSSDAKLKSSAYFNLGNTQFERKRWGNAISAYKNALESNPHNSDARYNLELALRRRKQQQKKLRRALSRAGRSPKPRSQRGNKRQQGQNKQSQQQRGQKKQSQQQQQQGQQQQSQQQRPGQQKQSQQQRPGQQKQSQQQRPGQQKQSQQQPGQQQQSRQQQSQLRPGQQKQSQQQAGRKKQQQRQGAGRGRSRHGSHSRDRAGTAGHDKVPTEAGRKLRELERLSRKAWLRHLREQARGTRRAHPEKDQ